MTHKQLPHIVSIHSFRRGTGKTTIAGNLAVLLAAAGRRVCLVDADVHLPGLHIFFGLKDLEITYSLQDYVDGKCRFEQSIYDVTPHIGAGAPGHLFLIPALATMNVEVLLRLLRQSYTDTLTEGFRAAIEHLSLDVLLIDVRAGMTEESIASVAISDFLYIVTRLDEQDYQGTGMMVELAKHLYRPQVQLIINEAHASMDFAAVQAEAERSFQCPVAAVLPHAEELAALAGVGIFVSKYPDHPLTLKLEQVVAKLNHK